MSSYQDVLRSNAVLASWAFTESSGTVFVPWVGGSNLTGTGTFAYRQAGPFAAAFALHLNVGAAIRLAFSAQLVAPTTIMCWVRLPSLTMAGNQIVQYFGHNATNGSGLYIASADKHLHHLQGGVADTDLGYVWPDTGWHLVQHASNLDGLTGTVSIDGQVVTRKKFAASIAASPNTLTWGGDDTNNSTNAVEYSYPSFFATELAPQQFYANYLGATDPDSALGYTVSGGGVTGTSNTALLNSILAAVRKTYQNAP